jgi:hypothetical protein
VLAPPLFYAVLLRPPAFTPLLYALRFLFYLLLAHFRNREERDFLFRSCCARRRRRLAVACLTPASGAFRRADCWIYPHTQISLELLRLSLVELGAPGIFYYRCEPV